MSVRPFRLDSQQRTAIILGVLVILSSASVALLTYVVTRRAAFLFDIQILCAETNRAKRRLVPAGGRVD